MMSNLFIGVDAGGTRTRAVLATQAGKVVGTGHAAGANSWSSGTSISEALADAMSEALHGTDPVSVAGGVIAIAGGGSTSPRLTAEIDEGWRALGLPGSPHVVLDVLAAYAAGTVEPRGLVLAAGTGAIAALVDDGGVQRRSGGHGWLVGDEGSAVWLGIRGIEAALRALDGRGPDTVLVRAVREALDVEEADRATVASGIVAATYSRPPAKLGLIAPLVIDAAEQGDGLAQHMVEAAADELMGIAVAVMAGERPKVIVLSGSLLTRAAPIRQFVRARLAERWPGTPIVEVPSGEAGAVALAISRHNRAPITEATLARLRGESPQGLST